MVSSRSSDRGQTTFMQPISSLYTHRVLVQELGGNTTLVTGIVSKYGKRLDGVPCGIIFGQYLDDRLGNQGLRWRVPEADKVTVPTTN